MRNSLAVPIVRLASDDYSVPRDSLGYLDEDNGSSVGVRWLPPRFGSSAPVPKDDLEEAGEMLLSMDLIPGWEPGRWWRVTAPDGSVWAETSVEHEARESMRPGDKLERLWVAELSEWREPEAEAVA